MPMPVLTKAANPLRRTLIEMKRQAKLGIVRHADDKMGAIDEVRSDDEEGNDEQGVVDVDGILSRLEKTHSPGKRTEEGRVDTALLKSVLGENEKAVEVWSGFWTKSDDGALEDVGSVVEVSVEQRMVDIEGPIKPFVTLALSGSELVCKFWRKRNARGLIS